MTKNRTDLAERERVMQEVQHPNKLKMLLTIAGLKQREVSRESGIPEGTLRHYVAGSHVIPRRDRIKLARVIGCDVRDLAPQYDAQKDINKWGIKHTMTDNNMTESPFLFEESDSCFSFGKLKTTWTVLDGDGIAEYTPNTLHCHYDSTPTNVAPEIEEERARIEKEQEQNKAEAKPFQWNGLKYNLFKMLISREPEEENMTLDLWFGPTDYYTSLATYKMLDDLDFRKRYFPEEDWLFPSPHFVNSIGTNMTVLTSDNHVILTQRSATQGIRPQMFSNSVSESASRPLDRGTTSLAPDMYRCAGRGLFEELGLRDGYDFVGSNILFLCFGVDTQYGLYGPRGMIKIQKTSSEILKIWNNGVKDKMESKKLFALPFNPRDITSFVFSHNPWFPGALPGLYFTLIHEFGRGEVDRVLSSY
jgi:transcriptional regulator with XRE-family HTH domain